MIHLDWVWGGGSAGGFTYGTCRLLEQSSELNVAFFSAGVFAILPGAEIEHQTDQLKALIFRSTFASNDSENRADDKR